MSEGNALGGKNPHGLYVPLTDVEREAACRAAERGIVVHVEGWGSFLAEKFHIGEHRIGVEFVLRCPPSGPDAGREMRDLQIQVSTDDGIPICACAQSVIFDGSVLTLKPGCEMGLNLEIEVHHCNPDLVKQLTGATGITSRRMDLQTGRWDGQGNMRLGDEGLRALHQLNLSHQVRAARARSQEKT